MDLALTERLRGCRQIERLTRSVRRVAGRHGPVARATLVCNRSLMPDFGAPLASAPTFSLFIDGWILYAIVRIRKGRNFYLVSLWGLTR